MKFQERLYAYLRDNEIPFTIQHLIPAPGHAPACDLSVDGQTPLTSTRFAFVGNQLTMLALCADRAVDVEALRNALRRPDVTLVDTNWLEAAFPDVEIETIPPLGVLWQLPVIMDEDLCATRMLTFHAGSIHDLVTLPRPAYERLTRPAVMKFAVRERHPELIPA